MQKKVKRGEHRASRGGIATGADVVAMNCPFCMIMFQDAVKKLNKEEEVELKDIAEIAAESL